MVDQATADRGLKLGINGFGRIGKLTAWQHVARKFFKEIVVNIGRESGNSLTDIEHYAERDSTYGDILLRPDAGLRHKAADVEET